MLKVIKVIKEADIFATHNDYLIGDEQNHYNYLAHWDGSEWTNAGNLKVAISIQNYKVINPSEIYAVGDFVLPGYRWKPVAKYNGSDREVADLGNENAGAYSTAANLWVTNENDIYATSGYSGIDDIRVKHWNGLEWSLLYNNDDSLNMLSKTYLVAENDVYSFGF